VGEVLPTLNWTIMTQTARQPLINFGTSSDRIGTREGTRAYYFTFAKGIERLRIAPYFSVNYSEADRKFNYPFGINIALGPQWDLLPMNDGRRSHLLLTYKERNWNITLMAIYMKHPGISLGFAF
jgi:hypothetical protein